MSTLRDFITNTPPSSNYKQSQLAIWKTNNYDALNGGQCCCWVVPGATSWAIFEVWGGGGDGAGACCCMGTYWGPSAGNYIKKRLAVTPGCFFTICAAGTGCCANTCCGQCGFPSYVNCGAGGAMAVCAGGGFMGCTLCFRSYHGCTGICVPGCSNGCTSNATGGVDYQYPSINNVNKESNFCWSHMWNGTTGSYKYAQSTRTGIDYCTTQLTRSGFDNNNGAKWPAQGGTNARACGQGCCWGSWGAGGLVLITYG